MEKTVESALCGVGIDCAAGVERVAGSEALFLRLLRKFLQDTNYSSFLSCMEKGDAEGARIYIHALKGLSANLSIMAVYRECVQIELACPPILEPVPKLVE